MINKLAAAKSATNAYQKIQVPIGLDGIIDGRPFGNVRQGSRIFYWAYPHNVATGGQKQMYRHVDTLNSSGFDAYIFHNQDGFRLSWFDNDTRVVGPPLELCTALEMSWSSQRTSGRSC